MPDDQSDPSDSDPDISEDELKGTPVFPPGTSRTHRRRLLQAMAGASVFSIAGCLSLDDDDDPDDEERIVGEAEDGEIDREGAYFEVDLDVPEELGINEDYDIVGTIENTGDETGLRDVALSINGEIVEETEFMLGSGESTQLEVSQTSGAPGDSYDIRLETPDDYGSVSRAIGAPDYTELDHMAPHWAPSELVIDLATQVAYDDENIYFRFQWDWDVPNGWFHDLFVYEDGEWVRYGDPNPGAAMEGYGVGDNFSGFTEDRLAFMIDDGSVEGFEQFGGWLTIHEGTRTLPGAVEGEEVENHPHHGDILENDDVRKYIPQSRNGDWWENDWDDVKDQEELDEMLENGEYLDMPMMRAHRGAPGGYATVHTILDHRHGAMDEPSTRIRDSQGLDEDGRPEYMFDPDIVENGALELDEIYDGNVAQTDVHALIHRDENRDDDAWPPDVEDTTAPFDPDVAEFEGAAIPRRMNFPDEVEGPGGLWKVDATYEDGTWDVEMFRPLEAGYLGETDFEVGEVYDWSPAVHGGGAQRWHWVGYPYKLALGEDAEFPADWEGFDMEGVTSRLVAEEVDDRPDDWSDIETYTVPCMYPGMTDWTWLASGEHPRVDDIRNADINIWEYHDEAPEDFAQRMIDLEERFAPRK